MSDKFEFEIEWIPEDEVGETYDMNKLEISSEIPSHTVDKICKKKYGHTNWVRMGVMTPADLVGNPCEFDYNDGIIYFKNEILV